MLRPVCCLLVLVTLASSTSENEELSLAPFAGPQRHLMVRPVASHTDPITVTVAMELVDVDVDEVNNKVTIGGWLFLEWTNVQLAWTVGSVESTRIMPDQMWTPDIWPYNKVPTIGDWVQPTPAIVYRSGRVIYIPPVSFGVRCQRNQTAGRDRLICPIKLGSWTYSEDQMDLQLGNSTLKTSSFIANGRWAVESSSVSREEKNYDCCAVTYVTIKAEVVLKPQRC